MKALIHFFAIPWLATLVPSFACAAALTTMAQKLPLGRTNQCDFVFPYYAERGAASIADRIEVNRFTGVYSLFFTMK